ncbi:hypothetical protein HOY80DRAFT_963118 [Tuber brumale]|nr:hypothetical protein HOY80DRAFT_963118 [Tuber brumale]
MSARSLALGRERKRKKNTTLTPLGDEVMRLDNLFPGLEMGCYALGIRSYSASTSTVPILCFFGVPFPINGVPVTYLISFYWTVCLCVLKIPVFGLSLTC